jgi:hypothetical protein
MSVTSPAFQLPGAPREGWYVATGKYVLRDPGIGDVRPFGAADRMQQHHAVIFEQRGAFAEKSVVEADANMFEHADRHDAIVAIRHVAVVL